MNKKFWVWLACLLLMAVLVVPEAAFAKTTSTKTTAASVDLAEIKLSAAKKSIEATKDVTLTVNNLPSEYTVKWSTSDKAIAKVSAKGKVTAVKAGEATISAKLMDGAKTLKTMKCKVTVTPLVKPKFSGKVLKIDGDLIIGEKMQVNYKFTLNKTCDAKFQILNSSDEVVYTQNVAAKKGKANQIKWTGKLSKGVELEEDLYYIKVTADTAVAKSAYFNIYETNDFNGGTGSKSNPYKIATIGQFKKMPKHNKCSFVLEADLDFEYEALEGLFSSDVPFDGTLDGKGHILYNIINTKGIFNKIGEKGCVKNLNTVGCFFNADGDTAFLTPENYGTVEGCNFADITVTGGRSAFVGLNYGTIKKCALTGSLLSNNGNFGLGGIAGWNYGKIMNCAVVADLTQADLRVGGTALICGDNSNTGTIISCAGAGNVNLWDAHWGAAGTISGGNSGTVQGCSYEGESTLNIVGYNVGLIQ